MDYELINISIAASRSATTYLVSSHYGLVIKINYCPLLYDKTTPEFVAVDKHVIPLTNNASTFTTARVFATTGTENNGDNAFVLAAFVDTSVHIPAFVYQFVNPL